LGKLRGKPHKIENTPKKKRTSLSQVKKKTWEIKAVKGGRMQMIYYSNIRLLGLRGVLCSTDKERKREQKVPYRQVDGGGGD